MNSGIESCESIEVSMETNNYAAIDPGRKTGVAIYSQFGELLDWGTVRGDSLAPYMAKLEAMRNKWGIRFAVIDAYTPWGSRFVRSSEVQAQIKACKDVFADHILILSSQWNSGKKSNKSKRVYASMIFNRVFDNEHITDAVLIGWATWNMARTHFPTEPIPFSFLSWLSQTWHHWPAKAEYHIVRDERMHNEMAVVNE